MCFGSGFKIKISEGFFVVSLLFDFEINLDLFLYFLRRRNREKRGNIFLMLPLEIISSRIWIESRRMKSW